RADAREVRIPDRRLPLRLAAARRDRYQFRPDRDADGGPRQHPRHDRVPEERIRREPDGRLARTGGRRDAEGAADQTGVMHAAPRRAEGVSNAWVRPASTCITCSRTWATPI